MPGLYLIAQQRSWSHINTVICALRFFSSESPLGRSNANEQIVAAREPRRLPVSSAATRIVQFLKLFLACATGPPGMASCDRYGQRSYRNYNGALQDADRASVARPWLHCPTN